MCSTITIGSDYLAFQLVQLIQWIQPIQLVQLVELLKQLTQLHDKAGSNYIGLTGLTVTAGKTKSSDSIDTTVSNDLT